MPPGTIQEGRTRKPISRRPHAGGHPRKAKEMLFESRFIDGREALELELVNRVYPAERLMPETMDYGGRVAENSPIQVNFPVRSGFPAANPAKYA